MRLCVECKHHYMSNTLQHKCKAPQLGVTIDSVTGDKEETAGGYCSALRIGTEQNCGVDAKWFEEKQ